MKISMFSKKGGVAKTTTAIHIAACLAEGGADTVVVDGDVNLGSCHWARKETLPFYVSDGEGLADIGKRFEHYIFDTQAAPQLERVEKMVRRSDFIVIPTMCDTLSVRAAADSVRELQALQILEGQYAVLVASAPPRPSTDAQRVQEFFQKHGFPIFDTTIRRSVLVMRASGEGALAKDFSGGAGVWEDYQAVTRQIVNMVREREVK